LTRRPCFLQPRRSAETLPWKGRPGRKRVERRRYFQPHKMIETAIKEDSFSKRFIYKLSANLVGVLLSFFQAGLVSRALGPRNYGDYNFLINSFNQFIAFLEMRSATFLYTSISRN